MKRRTPVYVTPVGGGFLPRSGMVADEVESKMIGVGVGNRDEVCEMAVRGMIAEIEDKTGGEL